MLSYDFQLLIHRKGESSWKQTMIINVPPFKFFVLIFKPNLKKQLIYREKVSCIHGMFTKHRMTNSYHYIIFYINAKPGGTFTVIGLFCEWSPSSNGDTEKTSYLSWGQVSLQHHFAHIVLVVIKYWGINETKWTI